MPLDDFEKLHVGKFEYAEPYDGPDPPTGHVLFIDGCELWIEEIAERGINGKRVHIYKPKSLGLKKEK